MEMKYSHLMLDIETTGLDCSHNAIIQIAAVKFNLHTGDVDPEFFNRCLLMPATRAWDIGTYEWWSKRRDTFMGIQARMEDPHSVMQDFAKWINNEELIFVGKPTHFDYVFLDSYTKELLNRKSLFRYNTALDMNSWINARYYPYAVPNLYDLVPPKGIAHDAIFDALHQIEVMLYVAKVTQNLDVPF